MSDLIKLIYFDTRTNRVFSHLFVPIDIVKEGAVFIDAVGGIYTVRYYDAEQKVAFALRRLYE